MFIEPSWSGVRGGPETIHLSRTPRLETGPDCSLFAQVAPKRKQTQGHTKQQDKRINKHKSIKYNNKQAIRPGGAFVEDLGMF